MIVSSLDSTQLYFLSALLMVGKPLSFGQSISPSVQEIQGPSGMSSRATCSAPSLISTTQGPAGQLYHCTYVSSLSLSCQSHSLSCMVQVCRVWHERCTSEDLWQKLCSLTRLGVCGVAGTHTSMHTHCRCPEIDGRSFLAEVIHGQFEDEVQLVARSV